NACDNGDRESNILSSNDKKNSQLSNRVISMYTKKYSDNKSVGSLENFLVCVAFYALLFDIIQYILNHESHFKNGYDLQK
ncbi:hypothetical protein MXB_1038, partial [Myxobolus squamalis]